MRDWSSRPWPIWLAFLVLAVLPGLAGAGDYLVDAEDVLDLQVFDEPDLSVEGARVSTNGTIAMPLVGDVRVAGLTTAQIAAKVERLLANGYLKKPRVSVRIHQYRQVFVNGAVNNPGGYSYQEGLTVQRAVVLAGGFNERASEQKITLIREDRPEEKQQVGLNFPVKPGDIITVGESFF